MPCKGEVVSNAQHRVILSFALRAWSKERRDGCQGIKVFVRQTSARVCICVYREGERTRVFCFDFSDNIFWLPQVCFLFSLILVTYSDRLSGISWLFPSFISSYQFISVSGCIFDSYV